MTLNIFEVSITIVARAHSNWDLLLAWPSRWAQLSRKVTQVNVLYLSSLETNVLLLTEPYLLKKLQTCGNRLRLEACHQCRKFLLEHKLAYLSKKSRN
jgi:hypothetical protein